MRARIGAALAAAALLWAQSGVAGPAASPTTAAVNRDAAAGLAWDDRSDEAFAAQGLIATWPERLIRAADGTPVWDFAALDGLPADPPASANPSLWRHARLIGRHGLFKVTDRVYQVRGFDIANMTVIEGERGYVVIDTLTSVEVAAAAMTLVRRTLGDRPVTGVIYTHPHVDHFGGARGVIRAEDAAGGALPVIAPDGFVEHAVSENVIAGPAMARRAGYQFGAGLPFGPTGTLGSGLGPRIAGGQISLIPPNDLIRATGETRTIDGVTIEFQMVRDAEAPVELHLFLPQFGVLNMAENANATLHNILTPRGALVRDAKAWADALSEAIALYAHRADILITQHFWPRWGRETIAAHLEAHRDAYKYLHDQSVRLMNQGLTAGEIAETLTLPDALDRRWFNRGYYGTLRHNAKAVYQRYLGAYDGNPATLNPWPPEEAARRYVRAFGGKRRATGELRRALAQGDYRWAAEVGRHLVFADPADAEARALTAQAFEQMAFQAESMIWRNMYLVGARELREGPPAGPARTQSADLLAATPTAALLDLLAVRVDPARAAGKTLRVNLTIADRGETHALRLANAVLVHRQGAADPRADAAVTLPYRAFLAALGGADLQPMVQAGAVRIAGDAAAVRALLSSFDAPPAHFPIVTP